MARVGHRGHENGISGRAAVEGKRHGTVIASSVAESVGRLANPPLNQLDGRFFISGGLINARDLSSETSPASCLA